MKIMAIDYGDARTGIAISDALGMLTGFTTVIHAYTQDKVAAAIQELVVQHQVQELVMGFPKNMDGSLGKIGQKGGKKYQHSHTSYPVSKAPPEKKAFWYMVNTFEYS